MMTAKTKAKSPIVIANLPSAGMCNLLFSWAKAVVFAQKNQLSIEVYGWNHIHIGPWLRGERVKRYYGHYFLSQQNIVTRLWFTWRSNFSKSSILNNPIIRNEHELKGYDFVEFRYIPSPKHELYFESLHGERYFIKKELFKMVRPNYIEQLKSLPKLEIAVHIRRGDFKNHPMFVENDYFIRCIRMIREKNNRQLPVTIFSDGYPDEFKNILDLGNVTIAKSNPDIVDLLYLSSATILVTSLYSTFSYWAAFLSDGDVILHPNHTGGAIRIEEDLFEGTIEQYLDFKTYQNRDSNDSKYN